jgi:hypothetical protein
LKQALVDTFSNKLPDQYYYTRLQDAAQERDDSTEQFGDRCRKLYQRTIRKVQDEEVQRIVNEEAELRLLAAYIFMVSAEYWDSKYSTRWPLRWTKLLV